MRVAIVHERFTELGGSERVVEHLHQLWPQATIFTSILDRASLPAGLREADIRPSPLQRLYCGGPAYGHLLPLMPVMMRRLPITNADVVVTSHHAFANRVRPQPGIPIVSYTHSPARWMWQKGMLSGESGGHLGRVALTAFASSQRHADAMAAGRLTQIVVNSTHVAERVRRWWKAEATVVHPPVNTDWFTPDPGSPRGDYFLLAGRLVPYKRPEIAVAAARRAGVRLIVTGDGRSMPAVRAAAGQQTEILGSVDDAALRQLYRSARALVFPGEEDFGLVPVEAQACGTPVVAVGVGGILDSVKDGVTGILYPATQRPVETLSRALRDFDDSSFDAVTIRRHAERFAAPAFRTRMKQIVRKALGPTA